MAPAPGRWWFERPPSMMLNGHGTRSGTPPPRHEHFRGRDARRSGSRRAGLDHRSGAARDQPPERARARLAGALHGLLRHGDDPVLPGPLAAGLLPGGAARAVRRAALALAGRVDRGRGRQERDHDGAPAARPGTAAAVVRTGRPADRRRADPRGVVPRAPPGTARRSIWPTSRRSRPRSAGGAGACPQMRLFTLIETGTRVVFGLAGGPLATGEGELARALLDRLEPGMLCLADRGLVGSGAMPRRPGPTCCGGGGPTPKFPAPRGRPPGPSPSEMKG